MKNWIIAYDITDPKRLQRIHRALLEYAVPIEYSVFLLDGSERIKNQCLDKLTAIFDPKEDDLRCYPLPARGFQARIGKATLPEGVCWCSLPSNL